MRPCLKPALRRLEGESGFTLIELLVVLIIIGLLAAIAIASFTGQQDKAHDADAKVAARSAQIAMETYYVDHRSYSGATPAELEAVQPSLQDAPNLTINTATVNQYDLELSATHVWDVGLISVQFGLTAGGSLLTQGFRTQGAAPRRTTGALQLAPLNRSKRMSSTLEMVICGWYELLRAPLNVTRNQFSSLGSGRTPIFEVAPPPVLTLPRPVAEPQPLPKPSSAHSQPLDHALFAYLLRRQQLY